ncbi:hypothetical protein [Novosphingobium sp. CF614]|uniref:hypothetical protein n=1 Tax=Novosphingobium sp. CF614 TaxID=1884364 RepID=UPI000B83709E|nr:hypothetical protein [Novosphingobium sp. CF614]
MARGAVAAVLLAPFGAHAADNTTDFGSRILRQKPAVITGISGLSEADKGRVTLNAFAECMVGRSPGRVQTYLSMKADESHTEVYLDDFVVNSKCLGNGALTIPSVLMRGAIFRALYLRDFAKDPAGLAAVPIDFSVYASQDSDYYRRVSFGDCVARADFSTSAQFVRAQVGSTAENKALQQLKPRLSECLAKGASLTLNKSTLAAMLAEAVYREAQVGAATDSSGTMQ